MADEKKHLNLKDILHKIVEHLDLSPADREDLHESVEIHDDPEAQAAKDRGHDEERAKRVADLRAQLADLEPDPAPTRVDAPPVPEVPAVAPDTDTLPRRSPGATLPTFTPPAGA
jgi:hypothetical protein